MTASIYAKPVMPRIVLRPVLVTLLIHGLLLYFLTANWDSGERDIIRVKPAPNVINARLVDVSEISLPDVAPSKPKAPEPKAEPPKPKVVAPKPKPKPKPKPEVKPVEMAAKPKPKPKPAAQKPSQQSSRDVLAALVRDELASNDTQQQEAATAAVGEMSASFVSLIQRTVVNYWSRPPSARNGMECELSIQLIPTGDVVSVTLVRSSGNPAFDSSAVNAVQKAGAFPELQNLPSGEFEKNFRRLTLIFKPEDLRY